MTVYNLVEIHTQAKELRLERACVPLGHPAVEWGRIAFVATENIFQFSLELVSWFTHSNPLTYFAFQTPGISPQRTERQSPCTLFAPQEFHLL